MAYTTQIPGLTVTNSRIDALMADFSGLENLEKVVDSVLRKLAMSDRAQYYYQQGMRGNLSLAEFDGWFAPVVRQELGKVLGIVRAKAVAKARAAGAGSAASAVLRRTYRNKKAGNINIAQPRKRLSSLSRIVPEPDGGESGIRRKRTVKPRTKKLREYYGPDRGFILRILEGGRDTFMATGEGPTGRGSKATWGKRGALAPRPWFFHSMQSDMELAAQELGQTLTTAVEKWVETKFKESTD